jgi:hypothetical protein
LYADDAKLGHVIHSYGDCIALQRTLNSLKHWSDDWGMNFNPEKCCYMSFCNPRSTPIYFNYHINNTHLNRVHSFNDLGILVTSNLTWDIHIENCISKANQRLRLVKRTIGFNVDQKVKLMCYKSLIRPLLEYATMLWSGTTKKNVSRLESLQRRATVYITNNPNLDYKYRLLICELLPLTLRRDYLDIVYMYNLINDLVDTNLLNEFSLILGQVEILTH